MDSSQSENKDTYPIDPGSEAEVARLLNQEPVVTKSMGGLFPEDLDLSKIHRVLDIACGPGAWTLEVAFAYPDMEIVGVDINPSMISYAHMRARTQKLHNRASFRVMDITDLLDFPDDSFDFVNAHFIFGFMHRKAWPQLMQECLRITCPGGVVRLTDAEWGFANTPAFEKYWHLFNQAYYKTGRSFSPNGFHLGITPMLARFLRDAGCQGIQQRASVIDFSFGEEAYQRFYHNHAVGFKLMQPFITKWGGTPAEELEACYQQALEEMRSPEFCALWFLLSVYGKKP